MSLKDQLENSLHTAMKNHDDTSKRTIRMVLTSLKLAEVEAGKALDDAAISAIIQKEIKMRRETISEAEKAKRPDMITAAEDEIKVLESFLPKQLTDEELTNLVKLVVQETDASTPADMGKVMKALMPKIQGRAAGDRVSLVVRQILQP